jgi:hypothetical protein
MKTIKNLDKMTFSTAQLTEYILKNTKEVFSKENEADSFADFCRWPDSKTDRNHLIMPGEVCLIDRNYNGESWIMICKFYGKDNGDKVKDLYPVIETEKIWNKGFHCGYFLIPDLNQ